MPGMEIVLKPCDMMTRAIQRRHWLGALAFLALSTWLAPAQAEDAPLRGAAIQLKELRIDAEARSTDVRGVSVDFQYRVGRVSADKALFLIAHFADERGHKVVSAVSDWAFRDQQMDLHGKTQLLTVPRYSWQHASLFVPFYAMKLAPGPHRLTLSFEGVSPAQSCKSGGQSRRIEVQGGQGAAVELVKPPFKMVQLLVQRVEVVEESTDPPIPPRKARPDLAWKAFFQLDLHKGKVHSSETYDDRFVGTWKLYSTPFPFSEGDKLTLTVIDRDLLSHDLLGSFSLSLDDLIRAGRTPLSGGSVKRLILGPTKIMDQ